MMMGSLSYSMYGWYRTGCIILSIVLMSFLACLFCRVELLSRSSSLSRDTFVHGHNMMI